MAFESRDGAFDEKVEPNLLAKKTLEHLQVISIAEVILKEKFNGDSDSWMTALFEALTLRNPAYLLEEKNAVENDANNFTNLNNELKDSFWEKDNSDKVINTGNQLINTFNKFMIGLSKNANAFDFGNSLAQLKQIEKYINLYIAKQNDTNAELSEKFSSQTISTTKPKELVKPSKIIICSQCAAEITIFNNDMEFSIDLHSQEPVHKKAMAKITAVESDSKTTIKPRSVGIPLMKHRSEADLLTLEEEQAIRVKLNNNIKNHSAFMKILPRNEFFCKLCKCNISSMQNVECHVEGIKHSRAFEIHMRKPFVDDVFQVDDSSIPVAELKM